MVEQKVKRYQECNWLVRRWRDRWYLMVPIWAIPWWLRYRLKYLVHTLVADADWFEPFELFWDLSISMANSKQEYWYHIKEVIGSDHEDATEWRNVKIG